MFIFVAWFGCYRYRYYYNVFGDPNAFDGRMDDVFIQRISAHRDHPGLAPRRVHEFIALTVCKFSSMFLCALRAAVPLRMSDSRCAARVSRTDAPISSVLARMSEHWDRASEEASSRAESRMASTRIERSRSADAFGVAT